MEAISEEKRKEIAAYNAFIRGLDLVHITLERVEAVQKPELLSESFNFSLSDKVSYSAESGFLTVTAQYKFVAKNERKIAIKIDATYTLTFKSETPVNDTVFQEYRHRVLHFTVWPFLRELAHSMTSRMGLPPLTLPMIRNV